MLLRAYSINNINITHNSSQRAALHEHTYDTDTVGGYRKYALFTYFPSNSVRGILHVFTLVPSVQISGLLTEFLRRVISALMFEVGSTESVTHW